MFLPGGGKACVLGLALVVQSAVLSWAAPPSKPTSPSSTRADSPHPAFPPTAPHLPQMERTTQTEQAIQPEQAPPPPAEDSAPRNEFAAVDPPASASTVVEAIAPLVVESLEELIVVLTLDGTPLGEPLFGFQDPEHGEVYLSMDELAQQMGFAMQTSTQLGVREGWILRMERSFVVDLLALRAEQEGQLVQIGPADGFLFEEAIYLSLSFASRLWPVDLRYQADNLAVRVFPRERMPFEVLAERQRAREQLGLDTLLEDDKLPQLHMPYELNTKPFLDFSLTRNWRSGGGEENTSAWVNFSGEYAYMSVSGTINYASNNLDSYQLQFARRNAKGNVFNIPPLREIAFGDVSTLYMPLVGGTRTERGVYLSSTPFGHLGTLDSTTITGFTTPGHAVELYRNELLLDFQEADENGRYEFHEIPLTPSVNRLRALIYAPEGLVEEREEILYMDNALTPSGQTYFRATFTDDGYTMNDVLNSDLQSERLPHESAMRIHMSYGLRAGLSFVLGLARTASEGRLNSTPKGRRNRESAEAKANPREENAEVAMQEVLTGGILRSLWGGFARFHMATHTGSAVAAGASYNRHFGRWGFSFSTDHFNRAYDTPASHHAKRPLSGHYALRLNGQAAALLGLPFLSSALNLDRRLYHNAEDKTQDALKLLFSTQLYDASVNLSLSGIHTAGSGKPSFLPLQGELRTNYTIQKSRLSWSLNFASTEQSIDRLYGTRNELHLAHPWSEKTRSSLNLSHTHRSDQTNLSGTLEHKFEQFSVGLSASTATERFTKTGERYFSLTIGFSASPIYMDKMQLQADPVAEQVGARVAYFLDENLNKELDEEEEILQGALPTLRKGRQVKVPFDERGRALLLNLADGEAEHIGIDLTSLEDPYLVAGYPQGYLLITPRKGRMLDVEFPIIPTGVVEGQVFLLAEGQVLPARYVRLRVAGEREVFNIVADEEGYYYLDTLPPGTYLLWVLSGQSRKGHLLEAGKLRSFQIAPEGNLVEPREILICYRDEPDCRARAFVPNYSQSDAESPAAAGEDGVESRTEAAGDPEREAEAESGTEPRDARDAEAEDDPGGAP